MAELPLNQVVRLIAWNVYRDAFQGTERGQSYGTCMTAMDEGSTVKLMRVADPDYLRLTPPQIRNFMPLDQLFNLQPAPEGGFRIWKYASEKYVDASACLNPDGSPAGDSRMLLKPLDKESPFQLFFAEKAEEYSAADGYKLVCKLANGDRYEISTRDFPAKEWVVLNLARNPDTASYNLFAVEPYDLFGLQEVPWQATAPVWPGSQNGPPPPAVPKPALDTPQPGPATPKPVLDTPQPGPATPKPVLDTPQPSPARPKLAPGALQPLSDSTRGRRRAKPSSG
jgi:hypothetical protein